ncbi:MAG TPA: hypothetical protein VGE28_15130 [Pseudomonas sp.]
MRYLFKEVIDSALNAESTRGNATYYQGNLIARTQTLVTNHGRHYNIHDDYTYAADLVNSMGTQFKKDDVGDWAGNYVSQWRMVSGNCGTIRGLVRGELYNAYQIGLDIRSPAVIGEMFCMAVEMWSTFGAYSSPSQDEGRR